MANFFHFAKTEENVSSELENICSCQTLRLYIPAILNFHMQFTTPIFNRTCHEEILFFKMTNKRSVRVHGRDIILSDALARRILHLKLENRNSIVGRF